MHLGHEKEEKAPESAPRRWLIFSGLLFAWVVVIYFRALPLTESYVIKLLGRHNLFVLGGAVAVAFSALFLVVLIFERRPRLIPWLIGAATLPLVILSGNLSAILVGSVIVALTLLAGDAISRLLRGREAVEGDLSGVFAAGVVAMGLFPLLMGEVGLYKPIPVLAFAAALALVRFRRIPELARLLVRSFRFPGGSSPHLLQSLWIALALILVGAEWVRTLGPDLSWDALAYHLPEALQAAKTGRVDYLVDLVPQTYFWRNHETFLSLAFLFDGERVSHVLQFAVGMGVFAAALALARRLGTGGSAPLVLLALAAFPTADYQLHAAYVDWPAAFLLTAAAAEIAGSKQDPGRLRLAGFLFGGAIATKVFVILAVPALALLLWRRGGLHWRRILAIAVFVLLALAPWLAWSRSRGGSFLAPYVGSTSTPLARELSEEGVSQEPPKAHSHRVSTLSGFLRLPYDLTFHSAWFEGNGNGYNGMLALAMLLGIFGWGARGLLFFLLVSLPVFIPWYWMYDPSVRYIIPVFPLYAVFVAEGVRRLTGDFVGQVGKLAGVGLALAAIAFPVQFGSTGVQWKVVAGIMSWDDELADQLDVYPLFRHLKWEDRVIYLAEHDRFHCPARVAYRSEWYPVNRWGDDPVLWRKQLTRYRITHVIGRMEAPHRLVLIKALRDRLQLVERRGHAALYRVLPEKAEPPGQGPSPAPAAAKP